MSFVTCHISNVTCHMLPLPTATAIDPPSANSPNMHGRMHGLLRQNLKIILKNTKKVKNSQKKIGFLVFQFQPYALGTSTIKKMRLKYTHILLISLHG